ncbi:MAG: hypothetical protein HND42_09130 [Armatimonadetes bacterium]|nr:hypothetical protein [Armatimonadota bacterium]
MNKLLKVFACSAAAVLFMAVGYAENQDTFVFPNNTGKKVNDLHVEWTRAVDVKSVTTFKKTSGSGSNKSDFSKGDVKDGESVEVTVSWDGTDPEVKSWYWTIDTKKVRDEKVGDVASADLDSNSGMTVFSVATAAGTIHSLLPEILVQGQKIRGTILTAPQGDTQAELLESSKKLQGYVVELQGTRRGAGAFQWIVPGLAAATLIVKDPMGKPIASAQIPVADVPPPAPQTGPINVPPIAEGGKPVHFDGQFSVDTPTQVTMGGKDAPVLVESPQGVTVICPNLPPGPTQTEVDEGNLHVSGQTNILSLDVETSKPQMLSGEVAEVTVTVKGCKNMPESVFPLEVTLRNNTPENVRFQGSSPEQIVFEILPMNLSSDGTAVFRTSLTALVPGGYELQCDVAAGKCGAKDHKMIIAKLSKDQKDGKYIVEWREDCYEGTCNKPPNHGGDHKYSYKKCKTHAAVPHTESFEKKEDRDSRYDELEKEKKKRDAEIGG